MACGPWSAVQALTLSQPAGGVASPFVAAVYNDGYARVSSAGTWFIGEAAIANLGLAQANSWSIHSWIAVNGQTVLDLGAVALRTFGNVSATAAGVPAIPLTGLQGVGPVGFGYAGQPAVFMAQLVDSAGNPIGSPVASNAVPVASQSQIGQGSFISGNPLNQ